MTAVCLALVPSCPSAFPTHNFLYTHPILPLVFNMDVMKMSIKEMKALITSADLSFADCSEKPEIQVRGCFIALTGGVSAVVGVTVCVTRRVDLTGWYLLDMVGV